MPQNAQILVEAAEKYLDSSFKHIDSLSLSNQDKVLNAFHKHRLSEEVFVERTGYGIDDPARTVMDQIYADVFGAESAAVRMQFVSGTHAIACALLGNLKAGARLACLTGSPYDTLQKVISSDDPQSLKSLGIDYIQDDVSSCLHNKDELKKRLASLVSAPTTMAHIQKSCGYNFGQKSLSNQQIAQIIAAVKEINANCHIFVDNCYGEFVEDQEPSALGADLIAGSLIKNPGGGLAISGGYIAGKKSLVEAALSRLTAPGIGGHLGLTFNQNRLLMQGLFLAPATVGNAVKGAQLAAHVFQQLGFEVSPNPDETRFDIIQGIKFDDKTRLINFLKAMQHVSPVNAHVTPEPADMPGYADQVVMAGGTFVEGSTIELSADGPIRPPYAAFWQGGLTYAHIKLSLLRILESGLNGKYPFLLS